MLELVKLNQDDSQLVELCLEALVVASNVDPFVWEFCARRVNKKVNVSQEIGLLLTL